MTSPRLRVAVCGGGIGGLTCALALSRYPDIAVDVYEAASEFGDVGAGIGIWPRPWKIIEMLGFDRELLKFTETQPREGSVPTFHYRKSDQREGLSFYTLVTQGSLLTLHRADFQQAILRKLPASCKTHCSKRLRSYTRHSGGATEMLFADGSTASCDVLIGADGLKSAARRLLLVEEAQRAASPDRAAALLASVEPTWSGVIAYRALIPTASLRVHAPNHRVFTQPVQYLGKDAYIMAYPISNGTRINFAAFKARHDLENTVYPEAWVSNADKREFIGQFSSWEPEVQELLYCIEKPLKWAIHTVNPLTSFVSEHVALLGDAAHAMGPHQGSGAGQAIEDAYLLSTLLGHPGVRRHNFHHALRIYDTLRRPIALDVMARSRRNGRYFTLATDTGADVPHGADALPRLRALAQAFTMNWEWTWTTTADAELAEARRMLERLL